MKTISTTLTVLLLSGGMALAQAGGGGAGGAAVQEVVPLEVQGRPALPDPLQEVLLAAHPEVPPDRVRRRAILAPLR
jgi:hypothetical protein